MRKELEKIIREDYQERFPKKDFTPGESVVPVSGKLFDEQELLLMTEAVLEGWWTEGHMTKEFEDKLAAFIGVKFCTSVNSGSSANLVAFSALTSTLLGEKRIRKGDEVITVAAGFPTTINPIVQNGCIPVFVDVELETLSIDVSQLEAARSEKTRAVMVAHTLGNPFNLKAVKEFCEKYDLWFIEDNCDGLGSEYGGQKTGSFGDISTLSFYPAHHITTAEGGAVFTNSALLNKVIRSFRDWGRDCWCPTGKDNTCGIRFGWQLGNLPKGYDHKYTYSHIGYNLKMTEIQAACGLAQMEKLPDFVEKRKKNYRLLREKLEKFSQYFSFVEATENSDPSWFGFLITLKDEVPFSREEFLQYLNEKRIATRLLFAGNITRQPYFVNYDVPYRKVGELKNSDKVMTDTFWVGCFPGITEVMIDWIAQSFDEYFEKLK